MIFFNSYYYSKIRIKTCTTSLRSYLVPRSIEQSLSLIFSFYFSCVPCHVFVVLSLVFVSFFSLLLLFLLDFVLRSMMRLFPLDQFVSRRSYPGYPIKRILSRPSMVWCCLLQNLWIVHHCPTKCLPRPSDRFATHGGLHFSLSHLKFQNHIHIRSTTHNRVRFPLMRQCELWNKRFKKEKNERKKTLEKKRKQENDHLNTTKTTPTPQTTQCLYSRTG